MTTFALQRDRRQAAPDDFPEQLAELLALARGPHAVRPSVRLGSRAARPSGGAGAWLLGSSLQSGIWAAEPGLPYAFADFINPRGASHAELVPDELRAVARASTRRELVAAWAIAADTDEEAERLVVERAHGVHAAARGAR